MWPWQGRQELLPLAGAAAARDVKLPVCPLPAQVLKYDIGEEYEGHYDFFFHPEGTANGGNRYLTVLT